MVKKIKEEENIFLARAKRLSTNCAQWILDGKWLQENLIQVMLVQLALCCVRSHAVPGVDEWCPRLSVSSVVIGVNWLLVCRTLSLSMKAITFIVLSTCKVRSQARTTHRGLIFLARHLQADGLLGLWEP